MSYELEVERLIDAPVDVVYRAQTDVEIKRKIAAMHDASAGFAGEIGVGRQLVVTWIQDGTDCRVTATFREVAPGRVVYEELLEVPPSPVYVSTVTETMQDRGGKTLFRFHVEGFPTAAERDMHRVGYNIVLDRLEQYLSASGS